MDSLQIQLRISSPEKYPAKQHIQRVAAKLGVEKGLIYLLGQYGYNLEDSDMPKTWRQRRYFYYCSGVNEPNACLTYDIAKDELVLYIEEIKPELVYWWGRTSTRREAYERYDVDAVYHNPDLFPNIKFWIHKNPDSSVYILHPEQKPDVKFSHLDDKKLLPAINAAREIKDAYEIKLLRKANEISSKAHTEVLRHLSSLKSEAQVQALFESVSTAHFANKQSYPVIAAAGENAATLHYMANDQTFKNKQLLLIDAGAEWQLYAADITRTYPLGGSWTTEAGKIYSIVENMQESCIKLLKPGACMWDIHQLAIEIAVKGLLKLGLLVGTDNDIKTIIDQKTYKAFYPHGLGHHVGLEVHDILGRPILKYSPSDSQASDGLCRADVPPLQAGMVITIEPGIYFNRYVLHRSYLNSSVHSKYINKEVLERFWTVGGVRIEDDFLITEDGYENLTTAPKGDAALEMIKQGKSQCQCPF